MWREIAGEKGSLVRGQGSDKCWGEDEIYDCRSGMFMAMLTRSVEFQTYETRLEWGQAINNIQDKMQKILSHKSRRVCLFLSGHRTELFGGLKSDTPVSPFNVWQFIYLSLLRSYGQVYSHPQPDSQPFLIHPDHPGPSWGAWETRFTWNPWRPRTPRCPRLPGQCRCAGDPRRTR